MQQRRDELQVKKARLEELRRQRRLRQEQFSQGAQGEETSPVGISCPLPFRR